jgi:hypothetical protein
MASTNNDELGIRPITIPDWSLGINTALPATEIADNEAQDILNFEFDDSGNLATRRGVIELIANEFDDRITSLHYFTAETGEVGILFTTGAKVYLVETNGTGLTDLSGVLILPDDTFWQWATYGGIAIGVNKATTGANPVKVTTSAVASALGGTPPAGKYIEVWNDRVWIASATEPNQVRASKLGNPEDWTDTGDDGAISIDVDADDGDLITGLFATRAALYVFKRKRIFRIVPITNATAPTVATNLKVEIYAKNIGCVSGYSIRALLDDVVFLSEQGLASLTLAQTAEDFRTALYSRNVAEIQRTPKATEEIPGFVFDTASQYWLSIPTAISLNQGAQVYVLDYLRTNEQVLRWTRFDGLVSGTAFASFDGANGKEYLIGAPNGAGKHQVYRYVPRDPAFAFSDNGVAYTKQLKSKAYSANFPLLRKQWHKWAVGLFLLVDSVQFAVQYFFDSIMTKGGTYSFNLSGTSPGGALWDAALWDVAVWDSAVIIPQDIVRKLLTNSSGQRGQDITFLFTNAQNNQGFVIKHFMVWYSVLGEKKVSEV